MRLSGESQAELIKAAFVVAAAGVIVYYGKKFVDAASSKLGSIANAPAEAVTALGDAVGSIGAAAVDSAKSGIEKAASATQTQGGTPVLTTAKLFGATAQNLVNSLMGNSTTAVPNFGKFDTGTGEGW